jgi:predicted nucleotidyltransferase
MSPAERLKVSEADLAALCSRYHVRELSLFGSAARGEARPDSDVDLLVVFEEGARVGLLALAALQRELSDLLGRRVDLVPKDGLKPALREEVLSQAEVLYAA